MEKGIPKTMAADQIKPYWRNPRNNRASVEALKDAIGEFGYNQFITVDSEGVVITGHARLKALKAMGETMIDVIELRHLSPEKAKAYRIVDNKVGELATWSPDLAAELKEIHDLDGMQRYFLEDLSSLINSAVGAGMEEATDEDVDIAEAREQANAGKAMDRAEKGQREVICPECGSSFFIIGKY